MATIPPLAYHFLSVNSNNFIKSTTKDKAGEEVVTSPSKANFLITNAIIGERPTVVQIMGLHPGRLSVSLKEDADKAKLTWSDEKYLWVVSEISEGIYVITPANGADLYWVSNISDDHIEVRPGRDIQASQNRWKFFSA